MEFNAASLSAIRSHVYCYVVLLNLILRLNDGLFWYLNEIHEDVAVELV